MTRLEFFVTALVLVFAMRVTVILATNEQSDFMLDRAHADREPDERDLGLHHPRKITEQSAESRKVKRAAEQEHGALSNKNNAERIAEQAGFVHDDSASASDVIRQLSENVDYDDETFKLADEDLEMQEGTRGDAGAQAKPTKYHYYPHNQHLYLLPECTTQQVCNLVYTRFNHSQPLCACPSRFQGPCSASISRNDQHTLEITMKNKKKNARSGPATLIKTCEETKQIRECRSPADWAVLALQNVRTGKSQYLVICNCVRGDLDGPMNHEQPAYARVPGIRVYGMMCNSRRSKSALRNLRKEAENKDIEFPWNKVSEFASTIGWN